MMDVTYGLISSFVRTKSVERVLAPIASQVSLLIILNEGANDEGDKGETTPRHIASCAERVSHSVEAFIAVANKHISSDTQEKESDMSSACEILDLARSSFFINAQKFQATPENQQTRTALVQAAKNVLQGVLKVLLVSDDDEVRKIVSVIHKAKVRVTEVAAVTSAKELLPGFKALTVTMMSLVAMVTKRQKDLISLGHRERLISGLTCLRKSLACLNTAMQTYLKYPENAQAYAGKESVTEEIKSILSDLQETLESKVTRETTFNTEEPGYFVSKVNQLLECLSEDERFNLHPDLDLWLAGVVRHSMAVAHICTDSYRDAIIHCCQRLLQSKGKIVELNKILKKDQGSEDRMRYSKVCESMLDDLCQLEESVNFALLHLVVDVFKESTEPLERLLKAALAPNKRASDSARVRRMEREFSEHADQVYQVAALVAASSTDSKRVRVVRAAIYHLEKLDPDIIPSIKTVAGQPANMAAMRHLKLRVKDWKAELSALVEALDQMVDAELFIEVSESWIDEDISATRGAILEEDQTEANEAISCLFSRSRRVRQIAQTVIHQSTDAIFMNGLLVFVRKLQQAESITKEALKYLNRDFYNRGLQETFVKHLALLKGFVSQVKDGLSAENHPDILSQDRMKVFKRGRRKRKGPKTPKPPPRKKHQARKKKGNRLLTRSDLDPVLSMSPISTKSVITGTNDEKDKISPGSLESRQSASESVGLGVKMSEIRLLAKKFVTSAVAGDKQQVNILTSDLLGWTNHIVDAAQCLVTHCESLRQKEDLEAWSQEADQLAPQAIHQAKLVAAGDIGEVASLQHTTDTWAEKLDKCRIHLDVCVEAWKELADGVILAIQKGDVKKLKSEITVLENHKNALCSLLAMLDSVPADILPEVDATLTFLKEQQDDLENLTITIKTTSDLTLQTGNAHDISIYRAQLGQLCREWAVMVTAVLAALNTLNDKVFHEGQEKIPRLREVTADVADVTVLHEEKQHVKKLVENVCIGNEDLQSSAVDMLSSLDCYAENVRQQPPSREYECVGDPHVYVSHKRHLVVTQWIAKMFEVQRMISEQTKEILEPLDVLQKRALDVQRQSITDSSSSVNMKSEYLQLITKMAANLNMLQQKVLNAIQLSPDLPQRANVRQLLDEIHTLNPHVLDKLKTFVEDVGCDEGDEDWCEMRGEWSVKMKQLCLTLHNMQDVRPSLQAEMMKLLTVETKKKIVSPPKQKVKPQIVKEQLPVTPKIASTKMAATTPRTPMSRLRGDNSMVSTPTNKPFRSIMTSAKYLEDAAGQWENQDSEVVQVAMAICKYTRDIADYCKGQGCIEDVTELASYATLVVENGHRMQTFIKALADCCVEESQAKVLNVCVDKIGSFTTQLRIITGVLQSSTNPVESERIVLRNASNLTQAVEEAFREAEAACVQGLVEVTEVDDGNVVSLVREWQRKATNQRTTELRRSPTDSLGLRRMEKHSPPSLVHLLQ